jgi:hypothetical protein
MKESVLRKLVKQEIKKVLKEYIEPYYKVCVTKKSELPKELKYHGNMKCIYGRLITAYWSAEERTAYVCTPGGHNYHAFNCSTEVELQSIVMKYDKVRADAEDDLYDKSKTHILPKEN